MFERLGIADKIKGKLESVKAVGEAVAQEAEIGFSQVSEILPFAAAEVGGTLPPDIQSFTSFSVPVQPKDSLPAEALVTFLKTEAAADVIKAKNAQSLAAQREALEDWARKAR